MFVFTTAVAAASVFFIAAKPNIEEPRARLLQAVELPTAEGRSLAALRLAKLRDVPIEQWIECMEAFGTFDPVESGRHSYRVKLWVEGQKISRQIECYIPPGYDPAEPSPLLLLLHESNASGSQMFRPWQRLAEQQGYLLLAPTDPEAIKGYSFSQRERDMTLEALRWMRLHFNVDENRIHVHGVSRGGHMTWDLGLRHRDRFASLIPALGSPTGEIDEGRNNMRYTENLWDMPIRDLQGSKDDSGLLRNLRRCFGRLSALGNSNAHLVEFEDLGHSFRADTIDWAGFLDNSERTPYPERLLVRVARSSPARNAWLRVDKVAPDIRETFPLRVKPKIWNAMDAGQKARYVQDLVDTRTGQVNAERKEDGSFQIELDGVEQVSLMLPMQWIPKDGKIAISTGKRTKSLSARASKRVLLLDFVEHFDRTVLPVCEVVVKP